MTDDQEKLLEDALGTVKVFFSLVLKTKNPYPGFLSEVWIQTQLLVFYDKFFEFLVLKMIFFKINICQIFLLGPETKHSAFQNMNFVYPGSTPLVFAKLLLQRQGREDMYFAPHITLSKNEMPSQPSVDNFFVSLVLCLEIFETLPSCLLLRGNVPYWFYRRSATGKIGIRTKD